MTRGKALDGKPHGSKPRLLGAIAKTGILPVVSVPSLEVAVPLARALLQGGVNALEVTLRTPCALDAIAAIRKNVPDLVVGAGTILTVEQMEAAHRAGAQFMVSPGFDPAIADAARSAGIPYIPGATSASEVTAAVKKGLHVLKFFPAEANGGMAALKLLHGPFPDVSFIPTGGMNRANIGRYLASNFVAACGGSYMAKAEDVKAGDWRKIERETARCVAVAARARALQTERCSFPPQERLTRLVGFGDFLLRLSPPGYRRFSQASAFETYYTGAEANVCASLAVMGASTSFVTRVPDNPIARVGLSELKRLDVDVSHVVWGGDRLGLFYLEKGASQRPSQVVYDRKHTGVTTARRKDFDWREIFSGASHFHFTGVTPALGAEIPKIVEDACRAARKSGCVVSCDLNYRKTLWTTDAASRVMTPLLRRVDYLIANEEDIGKVLGIRAEDSDVISGRLDRDGYADVAAQVIRRFPNIRAVAVTLRRSVSSSDNVWGAMLYAGGRAYFSRDYDVHIVDRVGGGDSFAAGLLYALGNGDGPQDAVEFAAAASCLKQTIELDVNLSTVDEIRRLAGGDGSGRIQR